MLNGLEPILIFSFFNLKPKTKAELEGVPLISQVADKFAFPPIPIYMSEKLTGLFIDTEEKAIDIDTTITTVKTGDAPIIDQRGVGNTITVNLVANKDSIGLTLLSVLFDIIFSKVTSQEYSITYLHGAITVFNGLLHTFTITQNSNDNLFKIKFELVRASAPKAKTVEVPKNDQAANLDQGGAIKGGGLPPSSGGGGSTTFKNFPHNGVPVMHP